MTSAPGTFRTSGDVRLESEVRTKAEAPSAAAPTNQPYILHAEGDEFAPS
jgi:hypothetical protein